MSKQEKKEPYVSYGSPFQVYGYKETDFKNLVGKVLTVIDSLGLKDSQEKAIKDLLGQSIWKMYEHPAYVYDYNEYGEMEVYEDEKNTSDGKVAKRIS